MNLDKIKSELELVEALKTAKLFNKAPKMDNSKAQNTSYSENADDKPGTIHTEFYRKAQQYWSEVPATVNGMLGGLGYISTMDIHGSKNFIRNLKIPGKNMALDCGAGIGRVTKNLLMPLFDTVDLVEQDSVFAEKACVYCTDDGTSIYQKRLGEIFNVGLQQFTPEIAKYDLVWSQWVLGHLTDDDLVDFFRRIRMGLSPNGYFVMKENVTSSKKVEKDDADSSVTRPLCQYEKYLKKGGFKVIRSTRQQNFPKGLYPVYMIACKPEISKAAKEM